ncbi:MAG: hypothetical protein PHR35_22100, partial [Kiritimatiellae bacterium]|nr:hypothetical protein [Kiritimatiellia bacterium]
MSDEMKVGKNGKPFPNEEAASRAMAEQELSPDVWGVVQREGGWVVEKHAATLQRMRERQKELATAARNKALEEEKYFWVYFAARTSKDEAES